MIIKRNKTPKPQAKPQPKPEVPKAEEFDISKIEFEPRQERRRGDRRRGYRRIDERNLVSRAQAEANSIREVAHKEGYKSGLNKAGEDVSALKTALEEFVLVKDRIYEEISKDILEISVEIAQKIIKNEVKCDKNVIINVVNEVLNEIGNAQSRITIKANPSEVEYLKENIPQILSNTQIECKILVTPDESIEAGGVIIHTNNGIIDATIKSQLEVVKTALEVQTSDKIRAAVQKIEITNE